MPALNGVAAEFCARQYGGRFNSEPSTATVGTSASVVAKSNPERSNLLMVNLSANTIVVRPLGIATLTAGIILTPNGGSFSTDLLTDLTLPSLQYTAIASGAASELFVMETVRFAKVAEEGSNNAS